MLTASCRALVDRYAINPAGSDDHHNEYDCAIHCECRDHFYRHRECKHITAWLMLYDMGLVTI